MTRRLYLATSVAVLLLLSGQAGAQDEKETSYKTALFAGGCFWSMESAFEDVPGVVAAVSGYAGGKTENPTYHQVSSGATGHRETVQVTYDPGIVSYAVLLDVFWHSIDPTDARGQFCDKGDQYRSAVFYGTKEEERLALSTRDQVRHDLKKDVVTDIVPVATFYPAESYHQDYHKKHAVSYGMYRRGCGRDDSLRILWGKKARTLPGF